MSSKLSYYKLSKEADFDLDDIFDYTEIEFVFNQAVKYLSGLDTVFESLVKNPEIGRKRNELRLGLYSLTEQEHIIFYRIVDEYIRIVRVLHGHKDIPRNFMK